MGWLLFKQMWLLVSIQSILSLPNLSKYFFVPHSGRCALRFSLKSVFRLINFGNVSKSSSVIRFCLSVIHVYNCDLFGLWWV